MKVKLIYSNTEEGTQRKLNMFLLLNNDKIEVVDIQKSMKDEGYIIVKYLEKELMNT